MKPSRSFQSPALSTDFSSKYHSMDKSASSASTGSRSAFPS